MELKDYLIVMMDIMTVADVVSSSFKQSPRKTVKIYGNICSINFVKK